MSDYDIDDDNYDTRYDYIPDIDLVKNYVFTPGKTINTNILDYKGSNLIFDKPTNVDDTDYLSEYNTDNFNILSKDESDHLLDSVDNIFTIDGCCIYLNQDDIFDLECDCCGENIQKKYIRVCDSYSDYCISCFEKLEDKGEEQETRYKNRYYQVNNTKFGSVYDWKPILTEKKDNGILWININKDSPAYKRIMISTETYYYMMILSKEINLQWILAYLDKVPRFRNLLDTLDIQLP